MICSLLLPSESLTRLDQLRGGGPGPVPSKLYRQQALLPHLLIGVVDAVGEGEHDHLVGDA